MMFCAHTDTTEDLLLGNLADDDAVRAEVHLASCDACREEAVHFAEERSLFERRAVAVDAPAPYFEMAALDDVRCSGDRRSPFARVVPAVLAIAACMAAFAGAGELQRGYEVGATDPEVESLATNASIGAEPMTLASTLSSSDGRSLFSQVTDESLACATTPSAVTLRVAQLTTGSDGLACVNTNHAMCEEPIAISQ